MKYTCLFKSVGELNVDDFDDEVLEEYGKLSVIEVSENGQDAIVSYEKPNGEKKIAAVMDLLEEWREKQTKLILNDLSDRVADRVIEKLRDERAEK